jgi:hypothetical protein
MPAARDPYEVLGLTRGASLDELKAAYRQRSKTAHPDKGGTDAPQAELNIAYAYVLKQIKEAFEQQEEQEQAQQRQSAGAQEDPWHDVHEAPEPDAEERARFWRKIYRDIDDEFEELRRAAEQYDDRLRAMRNAAWERGDHFMWAKSTWSDVVRFIRTISRSGLKGLALLFAALMGVGAMLVEVNFVSAFILIGSLLGCILSAALKSDKGGLMSADLLLFGVMTLWLPAARAALFVYPVATVSVLLCLALIFKFSREGGMAGLMTGGILALYMIAVILADTNQPQVAIKQPPNSPATAPVAPIVTPPAARLATPQPQRSPPTGAPRPSAAPPPQAPPPPEERALIASDGAVLKFAAGVIYHLKLRSGFTTSLTSTQGKVALYSGTIRSGECVETLGMTTAKASAPFQDYDKEIRACEADAIMIVALRN